MIPVRLAIRNFMSYTDIHDPLVFDGIHVACLSGENGAGKSTILDAITWALWGQSRAGSGSAAHLIHTGKTDMEVDFEFILAEQTYRVIRKWTAPRSGKGSGTSVLELSVRDGDHFRSISGNTLRDTEQKIIGLLRMTYTTFTNASFILQNRADAFTTRTPAERKQVLADILELAEYDRLQQRARDEVSARDSRHRELEARLREADDELRTRPTYEAERDRLQARLVELDAQIVEDEGVLTRLREEVARLAGRERDLSETVERIATAESDVKRLRGQIAEHERAIGQDEKILAQAEDIERGAADLECARAAEQQLGDRFQIHARLRDERGGLEKQVATARTRIETELRNVRKHLQRHESEAERLAEHEQAEMRARDDRAELERIQARQAGLERDLGATREQAAELRGTNDGLKREMKALREKIDTIADAPICPTCQSALDPVARASLQKQYTAEGKAQRAQYDENRARAKDLDGLIAQRETDVARLIAEAHALADADRRLATAEHAAAAARKAQTEAEAARAEVAKLDEALARQSYAVAETAKLAELTRKLDALGYDEVTHRRVRQEVARLAGYEPLARSLHTAREMSAVRREALQHARDALRDAETRLAGERKRAQTLREEIRDLPALRTKASTADTKLQGLRREHTEAVSAFGETRQRLAYLERLEELRKERLGELEVVLRDKGLFQDLAVAFGKNGIQAMLIETAIPELEDEANRLLAQMTDSRMHVNFLTQRTRASGEGQIETLDIVINDQLGSRPYELYSGGEAFRVNFAIRIALSTLLARRAGARLQTLVIDEGFGSQDHEGRERLVEAIKGVEDEFAMILVITHLDDLKERFPVRIDVRKTALGSVFTTEWAA
ncbi:MAG: SMC family ATPase [Chloroflexi bacterium]|nr:SMC family ATPase [Chloroflexota bacterium]